MLHVLSQRCVHPTTSRLYHPTSFQLRIIIVKSWGELSIALGSIRATSHLEVGCVLQECRLCRDHSTPSILLRFHQRKRRLPHREPKGRRQKRVHWFLRKRRRALPITRKRASWQMDKNGRRRWRQRDSFFDRPSSVCGPQLYNTRKSWGYSTWVVTPVTGRMSVCRWDLAIHVTTLFETNFGRSSWCRNSHTLIPKRLLSTAT